MTNELKTCHVAGGAYRSNKALDNAKTHVCEISKTGAILRVLCGRVKVDSILDDSNTYAHAADATCTLCVKRLGVK